MFPGQQSHSRLTHGRCKNAEIATKSQIGGFYSTQTLGQLVYDKNYTFCWWFVWVIHSLFTSYKLGYLKYSDTLVLQY